ncbi:APC family permease [Limosilactobacillus ingluviei]|uniref:APC family permease n=1 Tax=Limosilactobacillus ingluviei TaxID=148604 RepID=UPI00195CC78C|nr:amino acid permease [Limosilactobacillus ingluviei]MBM6729089.1 amino acid permease [Limosilactobacillus ingluviei]MDO4603341.1 amino acid permease [Limosilactobacillus ingluviei]
MNNKVDINQLLSSISGKPESERTLSLFDLAVLGIGAMIGTGILVLTGVVAATDAGPGVVVSFLIAALASGLIGMCYAELSTTIPNSGSAYVYAWVTMGQFVGFLAGWTLVGVYITTTATVANGWTGYFQSFLEELGVHLPHALLTNPASGGWVNLPALVMTLLITFILSRGTSESKLLNNALVVIKIAIILLFIIVSAKDVNPTHWHPFFPYGGSGVMSGAAAVFFTFLGFDALATSAEDAKQVQKNLPRAIIISLLVSTTLYVVVSLVMTGVVTYKDLNVSEAMATVLLLKGHTLTAQIVSAGAILGIMAVVYAFVYAGANVTMAMSRGGLLPSAWAKLDERHQSPNRALWINGILAAALAGFVNLRNLALIANVGSLTVFALISLVVILLRRQHPNLKRPFKVPFGHTLPILSILICVLLLGNISLDAWLTYGAWLVAGVIFYFAYSRQKLM